MSATITKDRMAAAVSAMDDYMETMPDAFVTYWRERGVDVDGLAHVAMQRGLRLILMERGLDPSDPPAVIQLTPAETDRQMRHASAWMDGFATAFDLGRAEGVSNAGL